MNRKILSGFLAVLMVVTMLLGCVVTASASEVTEASVSLSYSASVSGGQVTAKVNLTSTNVPLQGISFTLSFDNTKLSYNYSASKDASSGSVLAWASTNQDNANNNGAVKVTCMDVQNTTTSTGMVATLIFDILDSAVGSTTLSISSPAASDADNNKIVPSLSASSQTLTVAGYKVTVSTPANGTLTASATKAMPGETITLTTKGNSGYAVDTVTVTDESGAAVSVTSNGDTHTFTMPSSSVTAAATFKERDYTITKGTVSEGGTLVINPTSSKAGQTITVTATPNTGYEIESVSAVNASGAAVTLSGSEGSYTFTMPADDVTVSAKFKAKTYTITKGTAENGTITVNSSAAYNSTVTITLAPATGCGVDTLTVTDTSGAAVKTTASGENKYTFTMPASNVTVNATFKKADYTITQGTVTAGGKLVINPTKANYGDTVTITATPDAGYEITSVTATGVTLTAGSNGTYTFTMPASNVTVNATFTGKTFNIKTSAKNGTVTVNSTAAYNSTVNVSVAPAAGYKLTSISAKDADGKAVTLNGSGSSYTFTMPASNVTITAEFEKATYTVSVVTDSRGTASVNKTTASYGEKVTITATAKDGYKISYVTVTDANGASVKVSGSKGKYTFEMPASNVKVSVAFGGDSFGITVAPTENGTITAPETGAQATTVNFTVKPDEGYKIATVKVADANGKDVPVTAGADGNYSFTMPNAKVTISATFEAVVYNINSQATENGSFTVSAQTATMGTKVNVTVTPDKEYQFNTLTITDAEGKLVAFTGGDNAYTFEMPASDVTVAVSFEEIPTVTYKATIAETQNGTVALSKYEAGAGSTVTIASSPSQGYQVATVEVVTADGKLIAVTGDLNVSYFEMPESDVTVKVTFEKAPEPTTEPQPTEPVPANNGNVLLWVLPIILLLVAAAIVVIILILRKKK